MTTGMIHGRFQPFHNGHLDCLRWVAANADDVIVGITNPDSRDRAPSTLAPHRHQAAANPYPYFLRARMVANAANGLGIEARRLLVVPFFLNVPSTWADYLPPDCVHYVTVLSDWEESKAQRIEGAGYRVVRRDVFRNISAMDIRGAIAQGAPIDHLVPSTTLDLLASFSHHGTEGGI